MKLSDRKLVGLGLKSALLNLEETAYNDPLIRKCLSYSQSEGAARRATRD
jgi:hypothetical protein